MVDKSYMLDKAPPPSAAKRYIDIVAIPQAINAFADVEMLAEQLAMRARHAPALALALAMGAGVLVAGLLGPRRKR